jgi:hypothetical protein
MIVIANVFESGGEAGKRCGFGRKNHMYWFMLAAALVLGLSACGKSPGRTTAKEPPAPQNESPQAAEIPAESTEQKQTQIFYFFDRTLSMKGFAAADYSAYVAALSCVWGAAEYDILKEGTANYYEYGPSFIYKFADSRKIDAKKPEFYDNWIGEMVYDNRRENGGTARAFDGVKEFINEKINIEDKCLYIITTDLYEQNEEKLVFSNFFRAVFERGMSGAIFAVESRYKGSLYHEASIRSDDFIRVDGKSLFFILVAGSGNEVEQYCQRLSKNFVDDKILYADWLFLNSPKAVSLKPQSNDPERVNSKKRLDERTKDMLNLLERSADDIGLDKFLQEKVSADVTAYRLQSNVGSRYVGTLPANIIDTHLDYDVDLIVDFYDTNLKRIAAQEPTRWTKDNFKARIISDDKTMLPCMVIDIEDNNALLAGIYRARYKFVCGKEAPDWISAHSVSNLGELESSIKQNADTAKILKLKKVFEDIAGHYNNYAKVPSGEIYFEKRH